MCATTPVQESGDHPARGAGRSFKHSLALGVVLFGIWLLWSGHYTSQLITLGVLSCLFVLILSHRMHIADEEGAPLLGLRPLIYVPWLIKQVVLANIDVARRILDPKLPIDPVVIRVKASQQSDLGRVVYANSITLTPGTVSVEIQGDEIAVHALTPEAAEFDATGEMNRRVTWMEGMR